MNETWNYAVWKEQYSRKNNIRILEVEEEPEENLEEMVITIGREELGLEIVHRISQMRHNASETERSSHNLRPRAITVKFSSNKAKMNMLSKRNLLRGKNVVMEDMAPDIAKRLKNLKDKDSQ